MLLFPLLRFARVAYNISHCEIFNIRNNITNYYIIYDYYNILNN